MTQLQPVVAGNWKMNGLKSALAEAETVAARLAEQGRQRPGVMICPPSTLLALFADRFADTPLGIGAQDCHTEPSGAHTGDISAEMLADAGAQAVIVGHSERRADHKETDALVAAKAAAAHRAGLAAIVCVGETRPQREAGEALKVVAAQIAGSLPDNVTATNTIIAYEPVWAIGTGLTPTTDDIKEVHGHIRAELARRLDEAEAARLRILYGGSVKPANAGALMAVGDVNGALVGGASLKADEFWGIIAACNHN